MKRRIATVGLIFSTVLNLTVRAQTRVDLSAQAKNVDLSSATSTRSAKTGTALPSACGVGEIFFKTDAPAGQNWYGCTAPGTWTLQGGGEVPSAVGNTGKLLSNDGAGPEWRALGGDASGAPHSITVSKIQGRPVQNATPTEGQVLRWNAASAHWEPGDSTGGSDDGSHNYAKAFASKTSVSIPGAEHNLGTANLIVTCYDDGSPAAQIEPDAITVNAVTFDVNVRFTEAQSGRCVVNGSGGVWTGVSSIFGRTGAVMAQAGDYWFSQISGSVSDSQIAEGVSASKIGDGSVPNSAFQRLANVRSDIQQQIDAKADGEHSHTVGGDLTGDLPELKVTAIQNRPLAATAPLDGQALVWSAAANSWQPGSTGFTGSTSGSKLDDLNVVRTSDSALTIGANCSPATPCNVRFGSTVFSITRSCTATLASGSGTALIYAASSGTVTIGHNAVLSASEGCLAQPGVSSFPSDAIPLFSWTATSGAWDANGGRDHRAWLSLEKVSAGTGVMVIDAGGRMMVSVDPSTVATYVTGTSTINFPPMATGTCSADQAFSVPGASTNDAVAPGWPSAFEPGLMGTMRVSAQGMVAVRLCNFSGNTVDPPAASFRATIVRSF